MNRPPSLLLASATRTLATLRSVLTRQTGELARACCRGGSLAPVRLDQEQIASFELAWAAAELLAAETVIRPLTAANTDLALRLALTFAVDAIGSIADRLQAVALDTDACGAGDSEMLLRSMLAGADVRGLRRGILAGRALEETGRALLEHPDEVGQIVLDDELSMAQREFRRLAADVVAPLARDIHRGDLLVPEAVLQPLREMGVFGLSIPQRHGGLAPDEAGNNLMMIVVTEALSEASLAAAGSLITRPEILSRALLAGGTQQQKDLWLPLIARGEPLCAIAITEPDFGSDVAGLQLRASRAPGGWLLRGAKTWCTFAGKAGLVMVVARTDPDRTRGHRGLSIFLLEKPSFDGHAFQVEQSGGGRLTGTAIATIGYRGMHSFDLSFVDFFVPDSNLLGGEQGLGKGFYHTMAGMTGGRLQTAARASGLMRSALAAALRHAADRRVFNAPLAGYPLTRAKLARMAARVAACRQLTYEVGRSLDLGGGWMQASLVKLFACRSAEWVTREALQIHGGMGYAEEVSVSRYFLDARVLSIFEGAEETLALKVVARNLLENALQADAGSA